MSVATLSVVSAGLWFRSSGLSRPAAVLWPNCTAVEVVAVVPGVSVVREEVVESSAWGREGVWHRTVVVVVDFAAVVGGEVLFDLRVTGKVGDAIRVVGLAVVGEVVVVSCVVGLAVVGEVVVVSCVVDLAVV